MKRKSPTAWPRPEGRFVLHLAFSGRATMKKRTAATLLCLAIAFATAATADDQEFQGWMKDTQKTAAKLRKEIEAKAFTDVAADAATLQGIFKNVEGYFAKAHTDDAGAMSQVVQTTAKQLADAATSGNA